MSKPIELEIRGIISPKQFGPLGSALTRMGFKQSGCTRRTSVMSFGDVTNPWEKDRSKKKRRVDIRTRMTNGEAEVVAKLGSLHVANRVEIAQSVSLPELLTFSRMFAGMGFLTKVGSRETIRYSRGPIEVALVKSRSGLAYIEIEKMTDREHESSDLVELKAIASALDIQLIKSQKEYFAFCDRLTEQDDWIFTGTAEDESRLKKELKSFGSGRK